MKNIDKNLTKLIRHLVFKSAWQTIRQPVTSLSLLRLLYHQNRFLRIRTALQSEQLVIPTFLIYSITRHCNLNCSGCYAKIHQTGIGEELTTPQVDDLFTQAEDLGIGIFLIAGGEPFMRKDVIDLCKKHSRVIFTIFTNGLLLNQEIIHSLGRNVLPVISIEGDQARTNDRRGNAVYAVLKKHFALLQNSGRFWGVSVTATRENIKEVLSHDFIVKLLNHGCKLFFFVEYVPVNPDTMDLVLTIDEKLKLAALTEAYCQKYPAAFIVFPCNEAQWDGCLAAGRGFAHIQADGSVEPCPFAPYSDASVLKMSLKQALQSKFMTAVRKKHHLLQEAKGGCALWENREFVEQLLADPD